MDAILANFYQIALKFYVVCEPHPGLERAFDVKRKKVDQSWRRKYEHRS